MMLKVKFLDSGREPKSPPNPSFPHGMDVDSGERPACKIELPYPAPRCGIYLITCDICNIHVGITVAGRPDDPRSMMVPCKVVKH
jgi:hypothetical protein